jgi:hypothetical protein
MRAVEKPRTRRYDLPRMTRTTMAIGAGLLAMAAIPSARSERAVPFKVGETLTYDVSWSSYITAGTAVATVESKQPSGGSTVYRIVAEGRPLPLIAKLYPLYYRVDTLLDAYTLLPQRASLYVEEGARKVTRATQFDRKAQPLAQDVLSALYTVRASTLEPGRQITMPVLENGVTHSVRIGIGRPETVRTRFGAIDGWRLALTAVDNKGQPAGRNMAIWISTDARRLPLKLQADLPVGNFNLTLREVR